MLRAAALDRLERSEGKALPALPTHSWSLRTQQACIALIREHSSQLLDEQWPLATDAVTRRSSSSTQDCILEPTPTAFRPCQRAVPSPIACQMVAIPYLARATPAAIGPDHERTTRGATAMARTSFAALAGLVFQSGLPALNYPSDLTRDIQPKVSSTGRCTDGRGGSWSGLSTFFGNLLTSLPHRISTLITTVSSSGMPIALVATH